MRGRLATAGYAGCDNLTTLRGMRSSGRRIAWKQQRRAAHTVRTTRCCVVLRAGRGVLVEVRVEDGATISQEDNEKQRPALFMKGKGSVERANQKQRNALLVKNGRNTPMKFSFSLRGHCKG